MISLLFLCVQHLTMILVTHMYNWQYFLLSWTTEIVLHLALSVFGSKANIHVFRNMLNQIYDYHNVLKNLICLLNIHVLQYIASTCNISVMQLNPRNYFIYRKLLANFCNGFSVIPLKKLIDLFYISE